MRIKNQRDFWSALLFIAVGLVFAWGATSYRIGRSDEPGPGYFPLGLGLLLAGLGLVVLFTSLTLESDGGNPVGAFAWRPLLVLVLAVAGFGWCLPRLGLLLSIPLLVVFGSMAGDEFRWRDALLNAAVLTLGCWLIFVVGLKLQIPLKPWFMG